VKSRLTGVNQKVVEAVHKAASMILFEEHTKNLTDRLCASRKWILHQKKYPVLDCEFTKPGCDSLRLRLSCDEWSTEPASIELLMSDGSPLPPEDVPVGKTSVFNKSLHNITNKPFVCMRGSREYHTHKSHVKDSWEPLRGDTAYQLDNLLTQLWHAYLKEVA